MTFKLTIIFENFDNYHKMKDVRKLLIKITYDLNTNLNIQNNRHLIEKIETLQKFCEKL